MEPVTSEARAHSHSHGHKKHHKHHRWSDIAIFTVINAVKEAVKHAVHEHNQTNPNDKKSYLNVPQCDEPHWCAVLLARNVVEHGHAEMVHQWLRESKHTEPMKEIIKNTNYGNMHPPSHVKMKFAMDHIYRKISIAFRHKDDPQRDPADTERATRRHRTDDNKENLPVIPPRSQGQAQFAAAPFRNRYR